MARETKKRIDTVPTPRASEREPELVGASDVEPASAAAMSTATMAAVGESSIATRTKVRPAPFEVPTQAAAPSPLVTAPAPEQAAPDRRPRVRGAVWIGVAAGVVLALATGTAVYASGQQDLQEQDAALAAQLRVDGPVLASAGDAALDQDADAAVATAAYQSNRTLAVTQAQAAVAQANAVLAATPNAGDAPRAALSAASSAVAATAVAPATSPASLRRLTAGVGAPAQATLDAQAAWQAAESARIAAEQAATAQAQAAAAAAAAARPRTAKAPKAARTTTPRAAAGAAAGAAPAAAASGIPAGGKVCAGSGGSGAGESSVGAIGAAINAYRAGLGLPQLSVSRSGGLVSHAINMANTGGIWHSGSDNIVACVSSGSASSMVAAWSRSAPHDAQMRRTDVSSMAVGGASLGGWLFGAVKFS